MKHRAKFISITLLLLALAVGTASAWQSSNVTGTESSGYRVRVVSRSTQAIDYRHNSSTHIDLKGTDLMASAKGEAKVEAKGGRIEVNVNLEHMTPPDQFGLEYLTYVLWAITPEGASHNLGELPVKDGKIKGSMESLQNHTGRLSRNATS